MIEAVQCAGLEIAGAKAQIRSELHLAGLKSLFQGLLVCPSHCMHWAAISRQGDLLFLGWAGARATSVNAMQAPPPMRRTILFKIRFGL